MDRILPSIEKPTLVLNRRRVERNIARMASKARKDAVIFRPHFKTHQSAEIGDWFRHFGVRAITVSSIDMAEYFAGHGWGDIMIAFPANLRQARRLDKLAGRVNLNVVVESAKVVRVLDQVLINEVSAWLKIDTGYHRTGLAWDNLHSIERVAGAINESSRLKLTGILTHAGHTYGSGLSEQIISIYRQVLSRMREVQRYLSGLGHDALISVGDTPGCSLVESFGEVDEIRPGNFVFYDLAQLHFGSCKEIDIAVAVACPVVAKHPARSEIVIYGGAIHLSKESLAGPDKRPIYGLISLPAEDGWSQVFENSFVVSLSQEHGIVEAEKHLFANLNVGDVLMVLPVHSCLTANLFRRYLTLEGRTIEMAQY